MTVTNLLGYLGRLAEDSGGKVEIDAEGSIVITPATNRHLVAANRLAQQLLPQVPEGHIVVTEGPNWRPTPDSSAFYVPDVGVVSLDALRHQGNDFRLNPAPLLVVEILSPESRRRDLNEKLDAYMTGGAGEYWIINLDQATLQVHKVSDEVSWHADIAALVL